MLARSSASIFYARPRGAAARLVFVMRLWRVAAAALSLVVALSAAGCGLAAPVVSPGDVAAASASGGAEVGAFSGRSLASGFDVDPGRALCSAELPAVLALGTRAASYIPGGDVVSRREFLEGLAASRGGRYFVVDGDGVLTYPAAGGAFLSSDEWGRLSASLDEPATLGFCERMLRRADEAERALSSGAWPRDAESFVSLVRDYYGEFAGLVAERGDAVEYWVSRSSLNSERFYFGEFGAVIHEVVHEASAERSGVFAGRACSGDGWWEVRWTRVPREMWCVVPGEWSWVELPVSRLPAVATWDAPDEVREGDLWARYVASDAGLPRQGLAGVLQELQATVAELRVDVVAVSLGHMYYYVPERVLDAYYFWRALLLASLADAESLNPGSVASLPAGLRSYVADLLDYAESQAGTYPDRVRPSPLGSACREWADSRAWVLDLLS